MSSCCGCGSDCKCGNGCGRCKMYPDLSYAERAITETVVLGVAPEKSHFGESEMGVSAEKCCRCGADCKCNCSKC